MRTEQCQCGGWIEAEFVESCDGPMHWHVASLTHQIWRAIKEGWFSREGSTVPQQVVDLSERATDASASPASTKRRDGAA